MTNKAQAGGQVMSDIQETIDRLSELDRYASPAPWSSQVSFISCGQASLDITNDKQDFPLMRLWADMTKRDPEVNPQDDFDLIIETRNAIPVLLAENDRVSTRLAIAEARLGRVAASHPEAYLAALEGDKE